MIRMLFLCIWVTDFFKVYLKASKMGGDNIISLFNIYFFYSPYITLCLLNISFDFYHLQLQIPWGVPVHDDKKLFELLVLSGALAELTWPAILNKRDIFREVFMDFDPVLVSKLSEKKIIAPGSPSCSLLSEQKLRGVIENARQILK
ncbi:hypothetical protein ACJX0J_011723, partial [Zea mays]